MLQLLIEGVPLFVRRSTVGDRLGDVGAVADADQASSVLKRARSGPVFAEGYDPSLFYARDVARVGSCGYEAISDQLFNDGGAQYQTVKDTLLRMLKSMPWSDRQVFIVAMFGRVRIDQFKNQQTVPKRSLRPLALFSTPCHQCPCCL